MKKTTMIKAILAIAGIVNCSSADVVWPSDGEWTALQQGTDLYYDAIGDKNPGSIDLVGTTDTYSAGYSALIENGHVDGGITNDAFMFRLRLGGNGDSGKFVWQAHMDTDGDASNVEWILQLVQSGPPSGQGVEFIQTSVGGTTLGDVDTGSNTSAWLGDINLYSRWTAVSNSTDYHVDIAVPWTTFTSSTGVTELEQIRTVLSTSTAHTGINGDAPLGASLTDQISNVLSDNIPEPAVASLLLGSGFGFLAFRRIFNRHDIDNDSP
jgi:hypothetical protein